MLDNDRLLQIWETMWRRLPCEQAAALVAAAFPELSQQEVLALPIGRRDGLLMLLRCRLFGPRAEVVASCPSCGEQAEFGFSIHDLVTDAAPLGTIAVEHDGCHYSFRLPTTADLLAIHESPTANPRHSLVARCLDGNLAAELSGELVNAIAAEMEERDPQANVSFAAACPACGSEWSPRFDIVTFLWSEINVWAQRLIGEVHTLAATYGWSETAILAMNPVRRQIYLNLISS